MMSNYDKMVNLNKTVSNEKISRAIAAIIEMQQAEEKITVSELTKRTDLSRGFFYKNSKVRKRLEKALEDQKDKIFVNPRQVILDQALEKKVVILEKQNEKQKKIIQDLEKEIAKLKKSLNRKELSFIKNL